MASSSPIRDAKRWTNSRTYSACLSSETRMPRPNSALSSNREFDHAGPRPSRFMVYGVVGRLPPIDGRAAGGIRDHGAVAKQLSEQLDVWRFAAAGAGTREFEQRLQQLNVLDVVQG